MATDASQLLSLLRGSGSTSPQSKSISTSNTTTNTNSSSILSMLSSAASSSSIPATSQIKPQNDLDRLFNRAFTNSHPSATAKDTITPSVLVESEIGNNSSNNEDNSNKKQSASLLSLLKSISSPSPSNSIEVSTPVPLLNKNDTASNLLEQLMGSSLSIPIIESSTSTITEGEVDGMKESVERASIAADSLPPANANKAINAPPAFTFFSPFDLLAQSSPVASSNYDSPTVITTDLPAQSALQSLAVPSPIPTIEDTSTVNRAFLASTILASTLDPNSSVPDWAPRGVQIPLPNTSSNTIPEKLSIDIAEQHLESLSLGSVQVQPVTLFTNELKWGRGITLASAPNQMVYSTKGGKVRVIDRASGARILLKGHTTPVIELLVSPNSEIVDGVETRIIASIGQDGRLIVWKYFASQPIATSKKIIDVAGDFTIAKFSPIYPSTPTLAVVRKNGIIILVDLHSAEGSQDVSTLSLNGNTLNESVPIIDIDFSSNGQKLAILDSNRTVAIRNIDTPEIIVEALIVTGNYELNGIHLLEESIIISSLRGTQYDIISLGAPHNNTHQTSFILPPAQDNSQHFGHSTFHSATQTLFVSNSLRGSLFALTISSDNQPRISHVLEIPTPNPIVGFYLADSGDENKLSVLSVHPEGIDLIMFEHKGKSAYPTSPIIEEDEVEDRSGRRMSLEASILVESTTQIKVDDADPDDNILNSTKHERSPLVQRRPSVNPVPEELVEIVVESTPVSIPSTSAAINSAIKSMKAKNGKQSTSTPTLLDEKSIKQESPVSTPLAETVSNMWAAGGSNNNSKKNGQQSSTSSTEVMKELKRLEESIPSRVAKLVAKELEKISSKTAEERHATEIEESARHETYFKNLTASLSKATLKQLDISVKDQIKLQVVPSLANLVSVAVSEQVARGLELALNESLPRLEKNVSQIVVAAVVPLLSQSINLTLESLLHTVHLEMLEVRKSIVKEQSGALESTEREVLALKAEMKNMKSSLSRMENLIINLSASTNPTTTSIPATKRIPSISQQSYHPPSSSSTADYSLPTIPRTVTPVEKYEELFTNALQPDNAPEFVSLLYLINSSPTTRLDSVFPTQLKPRISPPVVLSLAYRLGSVIQSKQGSFDDEARKQLQYIRKCITAMDGKDPETAPYTPKILESVIECLVARCKVLAALKDARGVEEIRIVEQYCRSKYNLVSQRTQR